MKNKNMVLGIMLVAAVALAVFAFANSQNGEQEKSASVEDMIFEWAPSNPNQGTVAVKYLVQIAKDDTLTGEIREMVVTTNRATFSVMPVSNYFVRVQGVDAANRRSQWSFWSQPYNRDDPAPSVDD